MPTVPTVPDSQPAKSKMNPKATHCIHCIRQNFPLVQHYVLIAIWMGLLHNSGDNFDAGPTAMSSADKIAQDGSAAVVSKAI